jgi:hypothetical protein
MLHNKTSSSAYIKGKSNCCIFVVDGEIFLNPVTPLTLNKIMTNCSAEINTIRNSTSIGGHKMATRKGNVIMHEAILHKNGAILHKNGAILHKNGAILNKIIPSNDGAGNIKISCSGGEPEIHKNYNDFFKSTQQNKHTLGFDPQKFIHLFIQTHGVSGIKLPCFANTVGGRKSELSQMWANNEGIFD